jgi:outer membrane murein-binding lipoprotein Lpp
VHWLPIAAWCVAAAVALVVLGFCTYEIIWKTNRLRADVRSLQSTADQLAELRRQLGEAQERVAATGLR